ncbi:non-specific lipid-transfer protein 2-like [Dorcoceras hygrometricum]|uniref:Non-specific lipid-transfer protein 2-like n=1 Tax=Dorcoceras hygrometricum TaxID=472368 RepID=A0A2Z7A5W5_9LAMI|nr:non-specific lipid-transfer protein 2-like [Dorcoceras hygrometricum]
MKKGPTGIALWWLMLAVVVLAAAHETAAVTCNALELSPCMPAITGSSSPSDACCRKLKEQQPCLCQYMKNPVFRPYVDSPNAKKVSATCGVATPAC